ncbi:MAG: hypothetical protein HYZ79_06590 [Candidatus Melainabacteria bacterium]|nr:hypothetical protein [Candidatus Melainabacteria bacterium]
MSVALKQVTGYLGRPPITNAELALIQVARAIQAARRARGPETSRTQAANTSPQQPNVKIYRDDDHS